MSFSLFASDNDHLPRGGDGEIVAHSGYFLQYDNEREQARWVAYELTKDEVLNGILSRTDNFRKDPKVDLGSATLDDYEGSGFDRGHLAPASDLAWSLESMSDSFYLSNMSPQDPSFNRGIWKKLEVQVRNWAINNEAIYVVSGTLYLEDRGAIGDSHVDIPSHYYKVIYDGVEPDVKAIALIFENKASKEPLKNHVITIDSLEELSGLDFLANLDDEKENDLEDDMKPEEWSWSTSKTTTSYKKFEFTAPESSGPGTYWISKSGKRHNENCRYFEKSKGRSGTANEGVVCKICGG